MVRFIAPGSPATILWNIDYDTNKYLDYVTNIGYTSCILAQKGRLPETILETEPGVASRGDGANLVFGISPDMDRESGFLHGEWDVNRQLTLFAEGLYNRTYTSLDALNTYNQRHELEQENKPLIPPRPPHLSAGAARRARGAVRRWLALGAVAARLGRCARTE